MEKKINIQPKGSLVVVVFVQDSTCSSCISKLSKKKCSIKPTKTRQKFLMTKQYVQAFPLFKNKVSLAHLAQVPFAILCKAPTVS